jgi:hypothetical protein
MNDLTTYEGRIAEMQSIENSFITSLKLNNFDIAPDAICTVSKNAVELGIAATEKEKGFKIAFASEIYLYSAKPNDHFFGRKSNEINFSSSGSFDPTIKQSYWRTVHAASILKNWGMACEIVNSHCKLYEDLEKKIFELNPQTP